VSFDVEWKAAEFVLTSNETRSCWPKDLGEPDEGWLADVGSHWMKIARDSGGEDAMSVLVEFVLFF
jgi:hypothetical protein